MYYYVLNNNNNIIPAAPQDYQQTTKDLVFNRSNRRLCVNIPIVNNDSQLSVVQGIKVFRAILQTNAPRVTLEPNVAEIQILNGMFLAYYSIGSLDFHCRAKNF